LTITAEFMLSLVPERQALIVGDQKLTLSEGRDELIQVAGTHGWSMDGIEIFELVPPELSLDPNREQSILYASDLELGETLRLVMAEVERVGPARVVFDSLSEIRLLSQGALKFRRQVLALKHFFASRQCTVLFLDDLTQSEEDLGLHSLAHGVIRLEQIALTYGAERRRLRVFKMRGRAFYGGFHDYIIRTGGLEAPIAMHVLNNFLAFGLALTFGDLTTALNAEGGSSWWTTARFTSPKRVKLRPPARGAQHGRRPRHRLAFKKRSKSCSTAPTLRANAGSTSSTIPPSRHPPFWAQAATRACFMYRARNSGSRSAWTATRV